MRFRLNLPAPIVPVFWGLFFLEATYGAYLGVWPLWIEHLGAPVTTVGLMLGIGGFLRIFVLAPSAAIADRFGYRRVIVAARIASVIGFLGAAISTHWAQLILVIVAFAVGEMVFPLIQTIVAREAGDQRMRSFALVFNVGPSIALALSPLLGAIVVALFGMRAAFILGAVFSGLAVLCFTRLRNPTPQTEAVEAYSAGYTAAIRHPGVRLVALLLFLTVFALSFGVSFIPTFLEDVRGFAPSSITALGALPAIGSAVFGIIVVRTKALQQRPFLSAAVPIGLMSLAFVIFWQSAYLPLIVLAFFLRGGLFAAWATLISALGELAPERVRTRSFALLEMIGGVAFALGPMIAGVLYAKRETLPFEIAAILALGLVPVFLLAQRLVDRFPKAEESTTSMREDRDDDDRDLQPEPAV